MLAPEKFLSLIMMGLVGFVALCVATFSARYLKGDRKQAAFYLNLTGMVAAVFIMVSADHLLLFLVAWGASNLFLVRLMLHKSCWGAAKASALLALRNFSLGFFFLAAAFLIFFWATGESSLRMLLKSPIETPWLIDGTLFILLAAMTQSSLWPFHSWLISSLNSPTPVSAIMHAGLINGGGILLARFAPLLFQTPALLTLLFALGMITALLGTLWKLMQTDVKRMLACSTMGQMGFMMAQCGLGLFPAAIAHLCWHGLFKAYLFLASGSAAQEKRLDLEYPPSFKEFLYALLCGIWGAFFFALASGKAFFTGDTTLFLILLALIAGTQFALPLVRSSFKLKLLLAFAATALAGSFYGFSVHLVELALKPLEISKPQPLNLVHGIALALLVGTWLSILYSKRELPDWIYVRMLNASQPDPRTVTAHRNHYQF